MVRQAEKGWQKPCLRVLSITAGLSTTNKYALASQLFLDSMLLFFMTNDDGTGQVT